MSWTATATAPPSPLASALVAACLLLGFHPIDLTLQAGALCCLKVSFQRVNLRRCMERDPGP